MSPQASDSQLERWLADNQITTTALRWVAEAAWHAALASHAPSASPDICEKCGQEVIDGHWSLVCHKPACIKALQEEDDDYLGEAAAQPVRRCDCGTMFCSHDNTYRPTVEIEHNDH